MTPAPIAIFAFKRPDHLRRTLDSLLANPEASRSPIWVFCDGPRSDADLSGVRATREVVRSLTVPDLHVVEAERNRGLANSVIAGVTSVCEQYGRIIVLEDDLLLAPNFLAYMNEALERYRDDERVYQISGHMFPVDLHAATDAVFLPFTTSWGWGTWARAWSHFDPTRATYDAIRANPADRRRFSLDGSYPYFQMLERQVRGQVDSWAIRWNASVFLRNGLTLYPARTLVGNIGFDGTGTNYTMPGSSSDSIRAPAPFSPVRYPEVGVDASSFRRLKRHFTRQSSRVRRFLARVRAALAGESGQ